MLKGWPARVTLSVFLHLFHYVSLVRIGVSCAALLLLTTTGCGGDVPPSHAAAGTRSSGPDAVLVRIPTEGGTARAYRWGRDSVIWTSSQPVPALRSLLAFDSEQGSVTYVDAKGVPGRVELRLGSVTSAASVAMTTIASADGWAIFGVNPKREVQRLTPSGNWSYASALTPRLLLPQPDGSLVLLNDQGDRSTLRRMHPPEARITDTASVPKVAFVVPTAIGDRIYFATDSGLAGVRVRDLTRTKTIELRGPAVDAVPTPSGDRVFVATAGDDRIQVIDRYEERITGNIDVGTVPGALRMDPDGRYLLVKFGDVDSVAVVSVAESRVVRVLHTAWRDDLPLVAPDGAILTLEGADAVDIDPSSGRVRRRYAGGATDRWTLIRWNGFRPRAKGLDRPVEFDIDPADTLAITGADSVLPPVVERVNPSALQASPLLPPPEPAPRAGPVRWTLSFAALLDEQKAKDLAQTIKLGDRAVRVAAGTRDRVTIWRVIAGPYSSRDEAERAGRRTGLPFWVYEDTP
jgi:cell division septation protein DedD